MQHFGQAPQPDRNDDEHSSSTVGQNSDPSTFETAAAPPSAFPPLSNAVGSNAFEVLGRRYDVLAEAGRGAMGQVFKARDRETREIVALKILKPEIASDPAMIERFKSELLFARRITHKNVCRVYEFNRVDGIAYTSMEFVEGESLRSVLKRFGSLTPRKGIEVALQLCSGLKEAHSQGIVHRDLKPENVMIDTRGNVKIMDFGIARSMETLTLTTGALIGTPAYMAPEQAAGKPVDHRADIYALGLMLYEMFTGTQAFQGDNAVAVALKHINEAPRPPRELESSIAPALEKTILKCLEKDPNNRFQSIAELEPELRSASAIGSSAEFPAMTSGVTATRNATVAASAASEPPRPGSSKTKSKVAIGALLLVAAVGVTARIARHHGAANLGADVDQENVQIHSPDASVSITPGAVSISKNEPGKAPGGTPTTKSLVIKNDKVSVTEGLKTQPKPTPPPSSSPSTPGIASPTVSVAPSPDAPTKGASPTDAAANLPPPATPASTDDIPEAALPRKGGRYVWVNRFGRQVGADNVARKIEKLGLPVSVVPRRNLVSNAEFFVVLCGPFEQPKIDEMVEKLKSNGFRYARPNFAGPKNAAGSKEGPRATP